jgi:SAM-dependent methyltransferase
VRMSHHLERLAMSWEQAALGSPAEAICPDMPPQDYEDSGRRSARSVAAIIPPGRTSLIEFGCGNGRVTRHLARLYDSVLAVDIAPTMLELVGQLGLPNVETYLSDGLTMPPGRTFDAAYSEIVFIHNTHEDGRRIIQALAGAVADGGVLALHIPIYDVGRDPAHWIDVGVWTADQLAEAAESAACEVVQRWTNPGHFDFDHIGPNHYKLQVLRKRPGSRDEAVAKGGAVDG